MDYHLDEIVDRRNTSCLKYDFAAEEGVPDDAVPLWVADMDFQVAPGITRRLEKIVSHGIYGYVDAKDDYYEAVAGWYDKRFGYRPEERWIVHVQVHRSVREEEVHLFKGSCKAPGERGAIEEGSA